MTNPKIPVTPLERFDRSTFDPNKIQWGGRAHRSDDVGLYPGLPGIQVRRLAQARGLSQLEEMRRALSRLPAAVISIPEHTYINSDERRGGAGSWVTYMLSRRISGRERLRGSDLPEILELSNAVVDYLGATAVDGAFIPGVSHIANIDTEDSNFKDGYPSGYTAPRRWYYTNLEPQVNYREQHGEPSRVSDLPSFADTVADLRTRVAAINPPSDPTESRELEDSLRTLQQRARRLG